MRGTTRCVTKLPWFTGGLVALLTAAPWYILAEMRTPGFLRYFLLNENVLRFLSSDYGDQYGKGHPFPYASIWGLWLLGALPWSLLLVFDGVRNRVWRLGVLRQLRDRPTDAFLFAWMLAPMVLFTPCRNLVITYVLPGFLPMAILAGRRVAQVVEAPADGAQDAGRRGALVIRLSSLAVPLVAFGGVLFLFGKVSLSTGSVLLATACLGGVIVAGGALHFCGRRPVLTAAFACLVVPVVTTILVASIAHGVAQRYSAKHVVDALEQDPELRGRPVASYRDAYSGEFYSNGRLVSLHKDVDRLRAFCDDHPRALVSFRPKDLRRLPVPLRDRFSVCLDLKHVVLCSSQRP
jgi:4-amino-4-deoxy-L-arabinose transferase-like glycosyltransferase